MRLSNEELEKIKEKHNISRLWSWSMIQTFMTSSYEYFLKYVVHQKENNCNCAYTTLGSMCHSILEDLYSKKIKYKEMIDIFNDNWLTAIDIVDLKFDRNDENKNNSIAEKYKQNLQHFFLNHTILNEKVLLEKFIIIDINKNIFQGYIDALFIDENDNYIIVDWKTSTRYSGISENGKIGQLLLYAIGLNQSGVPLDKIKICWNFLKYVSVEYKLKNGSTKLRNIERCKIGESLKTNVMMWLKTLGYSEKINYYLELLIKTNDIKILPKDVQELYNVKDCYVYIDLTQELVDKWTKIINDVVLDIVSKEEEYRETYDNNIFFDNEESIKNQSYYFSTLCGYSPYLHLPYKMYLENNKKKSDLLSTNYDSENIDLSWIY